MEKKKSWIKCSFHSAVAVAFCDSLLIALSYWLGLLARYDFSFSIPLTNINLSNLDTNNADNMVGMFYGCKALKKENIITKDKRI